MGLSRQGVRSTVKTRGDAPARMERKLAADRSLSTS
jgi:hypothetical protein